MPTPAKPAGDLPAPPEAPRPGFRGWEEAHEAVLERQGPQVDQETARTVEARVVYLGSARRKIIPLPGALAQHEREDGTLVYVPAPKETEGNISYDFSKVDRFNRLIKERLTKDGHPFAICRHLGHLAYFYNKTDPEGNPEFQLRAPPEVREAIRAFVDRRRAAVTGDREHPVNVIAAMGDPWGEQGGDIGNRVR